MSGFVAIVHTDGAPVDDNILEALTASLYFRGPDKQQIWTDGAAGLGHTLFRTTDEARYENQPASLDNEVWVAGCIRIDAREALVRELGLQQDICLASTPDSHLVLLAYQAWGENCPQHLLGDFSFALWDGRNQRLFCARDRFGMRQLVYARCNNTFIVSNSIECLLHHPLVSDRLCDDAIGDFLLFGDHRWGSRARTSFADIEAIEPAHCLSLAAGAMTTRRYWELAPDIPPLHYGKRSDYVEHFTEILNTAVCDRLRTQDVFIPLSGGMDSSSIAATIQQLNETHSQPVRLHTATVLYDAIHPSDERQFVAAVSNHLQLQTHSVDASTYPLLSPPLLTTCPLELYQPQLWLDLDKYAGKHSRVVLNGDGGDEVLAFSGIKNALQDVNAFSALALALRLKRYYGRYPPLGSGLKQFAGRIVGRKSAISAPYPYPDWINPELEHRLDLQERWREYWSSSPIKAASRNPAIYEGMLRPDWNTDDCFASCGVTLPEKRSPFLDPRLLNFAVSLPALPWLFEKHILRKSMVGKLPANVLRRPKTLLGLIHDSMIRRADYTTLNAWKSAEELGDYIDRARRPVLNEASAGKAESYVNLRPLLLNQWLCQLRNGDEISTKSARISRL